MQPTRKYKHCPWASLFHGKLGTWKGPLLETAIPSEVRTAAEIRAALNKMLTSTKWNVTTSIVCRSELRLSRLAAFVQESEPGGMSASSVWGNCTKHCGHLSSNKQAKAATSFHSTEYDYYGMQKLCKYTKQWEHTSDIRNIEENRQTINNEADG